MDERDDDVRGETVRRGIYLGRVPFGRGRALAFVDLLGNKSDFDFDIVFANEDQVDPEETADEDVELEFIFIVEMPEGYRIIGTRIPGTNRTQQPYFVVGPRGGTLARGFRTVGTAVEYAKRHAAKFFAKKDAPIVKLPGMK